MLTYELIPQSDTCRDVGRSCNDAVDEGKDAGHILLSLCCLEFLEQQTEAIALSFGPLQGEKRCHARRQIRRIECLLLVILEPIQLNVGGRGMNSLTSRDHNYAACTTCLYYLPV